MITRRDRKWLARNIVEELEMGLQAIDDDLEAEHGRLKSPFICWSQDRRGSFALGLTESDHEFTYIPWKQFEQAALGVDDAIIAADLLKRFERLLPKLRSRVKDLA